MWLCYCAWNKHSLEYQMWLATSQSNEHHIKQFLNESLQVWVNLLHNFDGFMIIVEWRRVLILPFMTIHTNEFDGRGVLGTSAISWQLSDTL